MRVIVQRVSSAAVHVSGDMVGTIGPGLLLLVGFGQGDSRENLRPIAEKISTMRIFSNEQGRFDRSVLDVKGDLLAVPQFTLYADTSKGRRPEFFQALSPDLAKPLFLEFLEALRATGASKVEAGIFGADMKVSLVNDGPVTICLEH